MFNNTGLGGKKITQDYSYSFDNAESECDNQISLSPTNVKKEMIK